MHPTCVACPVGLHRSNDGSGIKMRVKATGGGAYKFAEVGLVCSLVLLWLPEPHCPSALLAQLFKERLGLIIEGEDEMACMVEGCNFLLNAGAQSCC